MSVVTPVTPVTPVRSAPPLTFATLPAPWKCISYYESTNNLTAVNPVSGTEGAFQFAPSTWTEYAPASFPSSPLSASLSQQLTVAEIVAGARGFKPWETAPLCGE
ncbi:transglycosylase family protein [Ferrimicrobium acidiphilum]|uniref:transglycosylase family protein n=1 Tax=Ferrimicrobium acidiphilum TaxID=121039 RepID=UPI003C6D1676